VPHYHFHGANHQWIQVKMLCLPSFPVRIQNNLFEPWSLLETSAFAQLHLMIDPEQSIERAGEGMADN
jgi:hypothetical protein